MLCLEAWFGEQLGEDSSRIKVFCKLGGNFLGYIPRPLIEDNPLDVIRSMQDEVYKFFKHSRRPSRYLLLFVGQECITPPNFPWVCTELTLDMTSLTQRIDVMYNEDDTYVLRRIANFFELDVRHTPGQLEVSSRSFYPPRVPYTHLLPELEVFAFRDDQTPITSLVFKNQANVLVGIDNFLGVESIVTAGADSRVSEVNFRDLAKSRNLVELQVGMSCALSKDVGLMVRLRKLHVCTWYDYSKVPTEVGLLINLTSLALGGRFLGAIPTELGHLKDLTHLRVQHTELEGRIPKELGLLLKLTRIEIDGNPKLKGDLPDLEACTFLSLEGSKNIKPYRFFKRCGAQNAPNKKRSWIRTF